MSKQLATLKHFRQIVSYKEFSLALTAFLCVHLDVGMVNRPQEYIAPGHLITGYEGVWRIVEHAFADPHFVVEVFVSFVRFNIAFYFDSLDD